MSCEEYARVVVDEARTVLERLEFVGALPVARRRQVAFDVAICRTVSTLNPRQRQYLLSVAETEAIAIGRTERETLVNVLVYCHQLRPRIPI